MIVREELPKKLMKKNFLIKVPPMIDEDEMEMESANPDNDPSKTVVVAVASDCEIEVGDEVIMQGRTEPLLVIEVAGEKYAMFREMEVEGVW